MQRMRRTTGGVVLMLALGLGWTFLSAQSGQEATLAKANKAYAQGVKAAKAGQLDQAEALFRQAVELFPLLAGAWVDLGNVYTAKNDLRSALEYYLKGEEAYDKIQAEKDKASAIKESANRDYVEAGQSSKLLASQQSSGKARDQIRASTDSKMADNRNVVTASGSAAPVALVFQIGITRLRLGQFADAEKSFLAATAKEPANAEAHFFLAVTYLNLKTYDKAAEEARKARDLGYKLTPEFLKSLETKGNIKL